MFLRITAIELVLLWLSLLMELLTTAVEVMAGMICYDTNKKALYLTVFYMYNLW